MLCHLCPPRIFVQEHNSHSITKAEGLAMKLNITAQQNTISHKKGFQGDHLYFFIQRHGRSLTISQLHGGWFSQEHRPETKFLHQGLKRTAHPKDRTPISMQMMLSYLSGSIVQGIVNVISVEPPMAPQKQRKTVTSQMQLMITTKRQLSWKPKAVEYQFDTLTNPCVKCQVLVVTTWA